jgi:hypothetical protein
MTKLSMRGFVPPLLYVFVAWCLITQRTTLVLHCYWLVCCLVYSCCSHLEQRATVKRFVSLQFLNLRRSVGFLGRVISPSQGRYLIQTQTDIHTSCRTQSHDPCVPESEDSSCLRPRGHCDRPLCYYPKGKIKTVVHKTSVSVKHISVNSKKSTLL